MSREAEHYESEVITAPADTSVGEVARRMERFAVGCVVAVDDAAGPLGIVTDRDLVRRVVAPGLDSEKTRLADVMSSDLLTGSTGEGMETLLGRMRERGVRRLPILRDGRVAGLVALDDIVASLGGELADLREALRGEIQQARHAARRQRRRADVEEPLEQLRSQIAQLGAQTRSWLAGEIEGLRRRLGGDDR